MTSITEWMINLPPKEQAQAMLSFQRYIEQNPGATMKDWYLGLKKLTAKMPEATPWWFRSAPPCKDVV